VVILNEIRRTIWQKEQLINAPRDVRIEGDPGQAHGQQPEEHAVSGLLYLCLQLDAGQSKGRRLDLEAGNVEFERQRAARPFIFAFMKPPGEMLNVFETPPDASMPALALASMFEAAGSWLPWLPSDSLSPLSSEVENVMNACEAWNNMATRNKL